MLTYLVSGLVKGIRVVQKDSCQVIHAHWVFPAGVMAAVVGWLLGKPLILTVHGSDARWAFEKRGLFKTLFVWVAKRADQVTTVNEAIASAMETLGIDREKIEVFPMGVSERFFWGTQTGSPPREMKGKTVILSNRHLLPAYNVDCLIRAVPDVVNRCDKILFLIAGDGESRSDLESSVRKMDLIPWVRFLGPVPHEGMPDLLKSSDIFVSTSPSDGTSVSLLEAMACGLFPVVTDIPANREWIRNGENGFLTPANDEAALAEKIKRAIQDVKLRKRAKTINAQQVREKATWERISQKFIGIYERLGVR
jgi:glycosyltransferase involved in cell wall biosynthesis